MKVVAHPRPAEPHPDRQRPRQSDGSFAAMLADASGRAAGFSELGILGRPATPVVETAAQIEPAETVEMPEVADATIAVAPRFDGAAAQLHDPRLLHALVVGVETSAGRSAARSESGVGIATHEACTIAQLSVGFPVSETAENSVAGAEPASAIPEADGPIRVELAMVEGELHIVVYAEAGVKIDQDEVERIFSAMARDFGVTSARLSFRLSSTGRQK